MRLLAIGVFALVVLLDAKAYAAELVDAWFGTPTDIYPHRIMGEIPERLVLHARDSAGRRYDVDLRDTGPDHNVFEDIAPRLADADGDGQVDLIVVESSQSEGAQLAVYGLRQGRLRKVAATPHIGTRFRWLAPVAIADLDGDGRIDLAYVDRPHLGKTLRIWSWAAGGLTQIAEMPGLTNHRIGDAFIWGGLRLCDQGPEMVLADGDFRSVVIVRMTSRGLERHATNISADSAGFDAAMACANQG
jgi:hypothetical protein